MTACVRDLGLKYQTNNALPVKQSLTISNWNLERILPTQKRLVDIQKYFSESQSDIWFLTETHKDVNPCEGFFPVFSGKPDRDSKEDERWIGIWSRWPIEQLDTYVSDTARCASGRIPNSPFGELILYGTVLPWTNSWRGIPGAGGQAFEAALDVQKRDWLSLKEEFPMATLVVAGDFNQDLAAWHYYGSRKKRELLEAALGECDLVALTNGASDPIARDSAPMACIDHICISTKRDWTLGLSSRWPEAPKPINALSDHFGITVRLVL